MLVFGVHLELVSLSVGCLIEGLEVVRVEHGDGSLVSCGFLDLAGGNEVLGSDTWLLDLVVLEQLLLVHGLFLVGGGSDDGFGLGVLAVRSVVDGLETRTGVEVIRVWSILVVRQDVLIHPA